MSRDDVPASLDRRVRERARQRCEYCLIAQEGQEATFHIDHVRPRREGGATAAENLALACVSCSLRKGARTAAIDPSSGDATELFDPRTDRWEEHFRLADAVIEGRTARGRATVSVLRMNRPVAVEIRREEIRRRRYP